MTLLPILSILPPPPILSPSRTHHITRRQSVADGACHLFFEVLRSTLMYMLYG